MRNPTIGGWRGRLAGACIALAAATSALSCGKTLEIAGDELHGGDSAVDGPGLDGSTASEGGDAAAPVEVKIGNVKVTLESPTLDLLAGGAARKLTLAVERLVNDTTPVIVTFIPPTGLIIPAIPAIGGTVTSASTEVTATGTAAPRRTTMNIQIEAGSAKATLPLVFRISQELRGAGTMKLAIEPPDGPQVYSVAAWGAGGDPSLGGGGGFVSGDVSASVGETIIIEVGAPGTTAATRAFPGGGVGGTRTDGGNRGGGGGGYSAVFVGTDVSLSSARLVAGAGGGGAAADGTNGTGGGGGSVSTGAAMAGNGTFPGKGGSSTAPGAGGGGAPSYGQERLGGPGSDDPMFPGGGGGGGIFGGGGGGPGSGGGGGASLTPAGGTSMPANSLGNAGNNGDPRRVGAGNKGAPGAVLIVPK